MSVIRFFVEVAGGERFYDFDRDEVVVGRDREADLTLDDRRLSRRHCVFRRREDAEWTVQDLGSTNRTVRNGMPVEGETVLADGDRLELGALRITVRFARKSELAAVSATDTPAWAASVHDLDGEGGGGDASAEARTLEHLTSVNARIAAVEDEDQLLDAILDAALDLVGGGRGFVCVREADHVVLRRARRAGGGTILDPASSMSVTVAQEALRQGKTVLSEDAVVDDRFVKHQSVVNLALRSVLAVPLRAAGEVLGAIYLDDADRAGAFGPGEVRRLEAFAVQAAIALRHCRETRVSDARRREALRQSRKIERLNGRLRRLLRARTSALRRAREALAKQADELGLRYRYDQIVGRSPAMCEVLRVVDRVTDLTLPVLVVGESGTGKELIARAIHFNGPRRRGRIVGENCAAVPESLAESEFFGHMRGAFTGAARDQPGLFEEAHEGTLFLDEVGEMPLDLQKKFLRVLEEGAVRRVGGKEAIPVDVRVISATNRDLRRALASGEFREDLYYRLAGVVVEVPSLRERKEDVPALFLHFLAEATAPAPLPRVEPGVLDLLQAYDWPGNVRELRNEVRRLVALASGSPIEPRMVSAHVLAYRPTESESAAPAALRSQVEDLERRMLRAALVRHGWNKTRAAAELGLSRLGLRKKLERYGMDAEQS
jgi:transcriptional regulator with GAF, ATPase, and Fis domain